MKFQRFPRSRLLLQFFCNSCHEKFVSRPERDRHQRSCDTIPVEILEPPVVRPRLAELDHEPSPILDKR